MAFTKLISFDRPLAGAVLSGQHGRSISEIDAATREEAAFHRGADAARAKVDQQIVEMRADMQQVGEGLFKKLAAMEPAMVGQLREALPVLAVDIARRLIAGYEPPPEMVARLCEEALGELFPERENLELIVSPRDAEILEKIEPAWMARYPGLRVRPEPALSPGDCQVRSRFGLIDARLQTKLTTLEHNLVAK